MNDKYIWVILVVVILINMLLFNRKVRLFSLIKEQLLVFKNYKTKKFLCGITSVSLHRQ